MAPKLMLSSAAVLFLFLVSTAITVNADLITIQNVRLATSGTLIDAIPLSDTSTTAYTMRTGFLGTFFDIWGGIEVCPSCPPVFQGPVVSSFVGLFEGAPFSNQGNVFYSGYGHLGNPETIGEGILLNVGTFTGNVTLTLADGTPLVYIDHSGLQGTNPTFSLQVTVQPPPPPVPEPTTLILFGSGVLGLIAKRKLKRH